MANVTNITFTANAAHVVATVFTEIKDSAIKAYMFRKTVSELRGLSRLELADLGMSYGGIRAAAHKAVYGV